LEVDNWLRTIELKFGLLHCTVYQKTLYVAQQLRGYAGAWWASYNAALQSNHQVLWAEFCEAFYGYHIPASLMINRQ
jgi:hypothetical protein